uniref:Uncharacterized protein n=1 Tax=Cacopsylla melanoneura TaxID=428564 RepID=A0A8D9AZB0_9HEMI
MSNLLLQSQEPRGFFRMNLYSREKLPAEDFDLGRYLYLESNENEEKSSAVNCPIRWQDRRQPRTKRGNILFFALKIVIQHSTIKIYFFYFKRFTFICYLFHLVLENSFMSSREHDSFYVLFLFF